MSIIKHSVLLILICTSTLDVLSSEIDSLNINKRNDISFGINSLNYLLYPIQSNNPNDYLDLVYFFEYKRLIGLNDVRFGLAYNSRKNLTKSTLFAGNIGYARKILFNKKRNIFYYGIDGVFYIKNNSRSDLNQLNQVGLAPLIGFKWILKNRFTLSSELISIYYDFVDKYGGVEFHRLYSFSLGYRF